MSKFENGYRKLSHASTFGVRPQCGQPNVNLRQVPAQVNE